MTSESESDYRDEEKDESEYGRHDSWVMRIGVGVCGGVGWCF